MDVTVVAAATSNAVVSDAQMWSLIVGFLSPLVIAVIQQPTWRGPIRVAVTAGFSLVAGMVTAALNGDLTGRSTVSCFLIVAVTSIAAYQNLWRPARAAPWIEAKTSRKRAHVESQVAVEQAAVPDGQPPRRSGRPGKHRRE